MKSFLRVFAITLIFGGLLISVQSVSAAIGPSENLVPDCERTQLEDNTIGSSVEKYFVSDPDNPGGAKILQLTTGKCTIKDFLQMLINLIEWFFAILGAAAFLMFLYGGGVYVFSMGDAKKTGEGKNVLTNTVYAIVVILGAYATIKFIAVTLGIGQVSQVFK